jgi:hypothetical protein
VVLTFELTVTDFDGLMDTDEVIITVTGGNLNCFIATAAFGTPMASQIQVLRDFRDDYMMTSSVGRSLVSFYYENSPPVANYIAEREGLRTAIRWVLIPVVYMLKYPVLLLLFVLMLVAWKKRSLLVGKVAKLS